MKLSHRIFLGYFLVVALAGIFFLKSVQDELRPAVRRSMEEMMVDNANLLAEIVQNEQQSGFIQTENFAHLIQNVLSRQPKANIWGLAKNSAEYRVYITDDRGIVLYDSNAGQAVGEDYSQWNDVYLTLKGKYGARSTQSDPNDESSSVMYVAAPILNEDRITGVLTVAKPNLSVLPFLQLSQRNILQAGVILLLSALLLSWIISSFLARSTRKLADYANAVKAGKKAQLPHISEHELSQLGQAIESMRQSLEGKEYVERYVHTLTHEIKSPLSGITGASELLSEEMDIKDRARFIENIKDDTSRIQNIVDRLLDLAKLEQQQALENRQALNLKAMLEDILLSHRSQFQQNTLTYNVAIQNSSRVYAEPFLIRQAINNIIDNAIDFSPSGGNIEIEGIISNTEYNLRIKDSGQGIPPYAEDKIFERFYSLPRPNTGKKSSGLGLSFVKEVLALHGGNITISSSPTGCEVILSLPLGKVNEAANKPS